MTAARGLRPALQVVPDPVETAAGLNDITDIRSQTVIDQYSPEHQFVGSLLWLSAEQARPRASRRPPAARHRCARP
jgi:hypothetical protein